MRIVPLLSMLALLSGIVSTTAAQQPTAAQALQLTPMQRDVEFDRPTGDDVEKCRMAAEDGPDGTAWVVRGPAGELLRRFVDSNGDNKVDQWQYFKSGLEVYRDIDGNFNGKADQYRWLGTAGTRWGLDRDEDGRIDQWKTISPEEVTALVIAALQQRDARTFRSVLLDTQELQSLGLGDNLTEKISRRIKSAEENFSRLRPANLGIKEDTQWIDFGALRPGTIPQGTDGSTQDVTVYENVVATVETDGKPAQIPIGTLIRVGDGWRVIDLPDAGTSTQFVFFEAMPQPALVDQPSARGISGETEALIAALEKIDAELSQSRDSSRLARLHQERAETLEKLAAAAADDTDREMWLMQLADTVSAAAQSGNYPRGAEKLAELRRRLEKSSSKPDLVAHVAFAHISSQYAAKLTEENADFGEVQQWWLEKLEAFVDQFPDTPDAPEAMLQLALAREFAGEDEAATRWYTKIVREFGDSHLASKAAGAKRRLESVGRTIPLAGRTIDGKSFDLRRLKGNVVLVHYWATWCEPCLEDMEVLSKLKRRFGRDRFEIVGVSLDSRQEDLAKYFRTQRPEWPHLFEPGGRDSRLANEMGIFTLPVMLLIDAKGKVANRQVHAGELESEIKRLLP